jgi:ABC-2 type transport system permease protein
MGVALRTRTVQSAPLMQVVVFMSIFTSVAYAPREVLGGWLRTFADWNPVTRILETSRAAELEAVTWPMLWPGLLAIGGLVAALGVFTALGLAGLGKR